MNRVFCTYTSHSRCENDELISSPTGLTRGSGVFFSCLLSIFHQLTPTHSTDVATGAPNDRAAAAHGRSDHARRGAARGLGRSSGSSAHKRRGRIRVATGRIGRSSAALHLAPSPPPRHDVRRGLLRSLAPRPAQCHLRRCCPGQRRPLCAPALLQRVLQRQTWKQGEGACWGGYMCRGVLCMEACDALQVRSPVHGADRSSAHCLFALSAPSSLFGSVTVAASSSSRST